MDYVGSIVFDSNTPDINKARWVALIREGGNLGPPEEMDWNTGEWKPRPDADWAYAKIDNCVVGQLRWSTPNNEIAVSGDAESVIPMAQEIAARLGGRFDPDALLRHPGYWGLVAPIWKSVNVLHDRPRDFLRKFATLQPGVGHLYAAHWCVSEVENGGLHQFFWNATGVLAPEAVEGFRAIGLNGCADALQKAMQFFGEAYPRDCEKRQAALDQVPFEGNGPFGELDDQFYDCLDAQKERFNQYANMITVRPATEGTEHTEKEMDTGN